MTTKVNMPNVGARQSNYINPEQSREDGSEHTGVQRPQAAGNDSAPDMGMSMYVGGHIPDLQEEDQGNEQPAHSPSRQEHFNKGTSEGRSFGALNEDEAAGSSLAQSMKDYVPNTATEDAEVRLAGAMEAL
jgi:hypothetical protein